MSNDARYSVENLSLRQILKIAYRAQSNAQITGGSGAILAQSRSTRSKTAKEESWRVIGKTRRYRMLSGAELVPQIRFDGCRLVCGENAIVDKNFADLTIEVGVVQPRPI
jgi:hypothetical protein